MAFPCFRNRAHGFSLVELSIVLVILGLLVGGVLSGQSLIRASELRSVVAEHDRYLTAVKTFRDKYFYLPGDMPNATSFWGMVAAGAGCKSTVSTDQKTCDGNGDGVLDTSSTNSFEIFRFWQQLANAGLIEGAYTGYGTTVTTVISTEPKSRLGQAYWDVYNMPDQPGTNTTIFMGKYGNSFEYGAIFGVIPPHAVAPVLTPVEEWNIDTKVDDGKPATGRMVVIIGAFSSGLSACTDTVSNDGTNLNVNYLLSSNQVACGIVWRNEL